MIGQVVLTSTETTIILVLLGSILAIIGYVARQQIRWMNRIEDKVNQLDKRQAVMSALMKIKNDEDG